MTLCTQSTPTNLLGSSVVLHDRKYHNSVFMAILILVKLFKGQLCFFFITEDDYPPTVSAGNEEEQPEQVKDFTERRHVEARG